MRPAGRAKARSSAVNGSIYRVRSAPPPPARACGCPAHAPWPMMCGAAKKGRSGTDPGGGIGPSQGNGADTQAQGRREGDWIVSLRSQGMDQVRVVLLFDLDGTLYRGESHMERYAWELERALSPGQKTAFRRAAQSYLNREEPAPGYDDWDSLARIADRCGVDAGAMEQAFLRTRRVMLSGQCPLEVPDGLPDFLDSVGGVALRMAMSNSPASSVDPLLSNLGLLRHLDRTEASAHKPHGFVVRVQEALAQVSLVGAPVLSIGDHLRNDIEPAREAGWDTAYLRAREDFPDGPSTYRASSLEALLPDLADWVWRRAGLDGRGSSSPRPLSGS